MLAPEAFTTLPHFAMSVLIVAANASGVLDIGSMPWLASNFFMPGSAITFAISALRRATISFGVAAGASTPSQIDTSKPVRPDSASVGTFGAAGERFGLVM